MLVDVLTNGSNVSRGEPSEGGGCIDGLRLSPPVVREKGEGLLRGEKPYVANQEKT